MVGLREVSHLVEGAFVTWMVTAVCRYSSHQSRAKQLQTHTRTQTHTNKALDVVSDRVTSF